ncbi:MAG: DNA mismatch repair protein MutS [Acidobacteria bacterium]|nr:MAG: DNA mismatch repair protein MutS [Acidobacteriota bacterium]
MPDQTIDPRAEYSLRIEARLAEAASQFQRFRRIGLVRLIFVAVFLLLAGFVYNGLSFWWLLVPVTGFLVLGPVQQRITDQKRRCERAADLYRKGLDRLDDRWVGKGSTGERFLERSHPYAEDLDLFGTGSLFELLSTARTRVGEHTLADWLLRPAPLEIVRERQESVVELRPCLDLREDMALLSEGIHTGSDAKTLTAWAAAPPWVISNTTRWMARLLALLAMVGLGLWIAGFGYLPLLFFVFVGQLFVFRHRSPMLEVIRSVDAPGKDLQLLVDVLRRLERERFSSPYLARLRGELDVEGLPPSQQIAKLKRLVELLDSARNIIFAPVAFMLLWPLQCAIAIETWRQISGPAVGKWLAAVGEFEALSSFAGYSFEHPADPFPELVEDGACFEGIEIGHPLLAAAHNVRTSIELSDELSLVIVSGSNMSGKSTLLRTVGTNTVLALAGAPVRAERLRVSFLQIGASIRIQDSLQAGASKFYAEITRLRQIVELTQLQMSEETRGRKVEAHNALRVLFLLDEILHGTNSHDRKIGAEAVVKGLLERGAIGLITTHDLALTQIVDELGPHASNVHFEDHLEAGKMTFDYQLRPGVLQKSNALELMRSVGLDV